jgi:hypothetical protein
MYPELVDQTEVKQYRPLQVWVDLLARLVAIGKLEQARLDTILRCGSQFFRDVFEDGCVEATRASCGDSLCWRCMSRDKRSLMEALVSQIHHWYGKDGFNDGVQLSYFVLTMPDWLTYLVTEKDLSWLRSFAVSIVQDELGGVMIASADGRQKKRRRVVIGGLAANHIMHSFDPLKKGNVWRGWFPHVNVVVLDRQYDHMGSWYGVDGTRYDGAFVHRKVSLSPDVVNGMRLRLAGRWENGLRRHFGIPADFHPTEGRGRKGFESSWNVNYSYGDTTEDSDRIIAYVMRPSTYDAVMEAIEGGAPSDDELGWVDRMLAHDRGKKSYTYFGWMADCVSSGFADKLREQGNRAFVRPRLSEIRKNLRARFCLLHGSPLKMRLGPYPLGSSMLEGVPVRVYRPEGGGRG